MNLKDRDDVKDTTPLSTSSQTTTPPTTDAEEYAKMCASPTYFIKVAWGLTPQPLLPAYETQYKEGALLTGKEWEAFASSVRPEWFLPYEDGKHITWQQALALIGVRKALLGQAPSRISIVSGHGIGKSALLSWLILWFLYVNPFSQVACTSPSKEQMYDVLWKELAKWIERMPPQMGQMYLWESSHIRMKESLQTWFARAKTSSKENTEALAGVHADHVMIDVDEASGVEEPIFETMEGALTSGNTLVFLISNGTRNTGYFYDTHHKDSARWQNYSFSSLESPRVDQKYVDNIVQKYGTDSTQYAIRVLGKFPDEGVMDDKGYVQLFSENDLHLVPNDPDWEPAGRVVAALDASGEGQDETAWAIRDRQRAAIVATEKTSSAGSMALHSITLLTKYRVSPEDFIIDAFGSGHAVSQEIALATAKYPTPWRVKPINSGEQCDLDVDKELYVNKRAEGYYKLLKWLRSGGEIMSYPKLREQLLSIRFRRTVGGRIQIMGKVEMKKMGFPSPDLADALSYTMLTPEDSYTREELMEIREQRLDRASAIQEESGII